MNSKFRCTSFGRYMSIVAVCFFILPVPSKAGTSGWLSVNGGVFPDPLLACQDYWGVNTAMKALVFIKATTDPAFNECWTRPYSQVPRENHYSNTRSPCPSNQAYNFSSGACNPTAPPKTLSCSMDRSTGNPCDAGTGNKYQHEENIRGVGGMPEVAHHYNSHLNYNAGFGPGWTSAVHAHLEIHGSNVTVRRTDGRSFPLTCTAGSCTGDTDLPFQLTPDASGYTLVQRDGGTERYSNGGRIVAETDQYGKTTTYTYDSQARLNIVTDPFGHTLQFGYDPVVSTRIVSVTDSANQAMNYSYDSWWNLTRVSYPDSTAKLYHYENSSFPNHLTGISYIDSAGVTTRYATYAYDTTGKAIRTEHAQTDNGSAQKWFTLNYDSTTQTTVTDAVTQEVMTFNTNLGVKNLVSKVNQTDGKSVQQLFDLKNNLTCRKDEENRVTTYIYDSVTNQRTDMTEGQTGDCTNPAPVAGVTRTTTYEYLSSTLDLPRFIRRPSVATGQTFETEMVYGDTGHPNLPTQITQSGFTPSGASVSRSVSLGYNSYGQVTSINGPRTDVSDITTLEYYECTAGGACGQLKQVTNALGHATSYDNYDANGRLLQMTDPNGRKTIYTYDPRGRVQSVDRQTPNGASTLTQFAYTPWGEVAQVIDADSVTLNYEYDAAHDLKRITDEAGHYIAYAYDLKGNRREENIYDNAGALWHTVEQAWDLRNHLNQITRGGSNLTDLVHDAVGNLVQETDGNFHVTTHQYDALNRLFQTVNALSGTTSYGHDPNDRPQQVSAPGAIATQYQYDDLGNLLKEISPDRGTTAYTYDAAGNLKTLLTARNHLIAYHYDALNRLTFTDTPSTANDITYVYDSCPNGVGRLCSVTNNFGSVTYGYGARGYPTSHQSVAYGYTVAGRLRTLTYPSGAVVTYDRDSAGRIYQVRLTRSGVTQILAANIGYAPFGPVTALSYGNGLTFAQTLDTAYQVRTQTVPGVMALDYAQYDGVGNLMQRHDTLAGQSEAYAYDVLDRLDTASGIFGSRDYDYDPNGNRTRLAAGAVTSYIYAPNTNRQTQAAGVAVSLDLTGNLTVHGNRSYTYNALNQLTSAYIAGVQVGLYRYNGLAQRISKQANGVTTSYVYSLDGQLLAESPAGGAPREYVYLDGIPLAILEQSAPSANPPAVVATTVPAQRYLNLNYSWNGIASPTPLDWVAVYVPGSPDANYLDWSYTNGAGSGTGSLTLLDPSLIAGGTYELRLFANDGGALLAKSAPFVVDPPGPVIAVTTSPALLGTSVPVKWSGIADPTSLDWVGLYAVGSPDADYLDYAYTNGNAAGNLSFPLSAGLLTAGVNYELRLFANDSGNRLATTPPFTVVAGAGQSTAVYYVHNDHLGTPLALTDSTGSTVWRASYDPFGEVTITTQVVQNNVRYAGMYADSETGLYYSWNNYYDPKTGRWITPDKMSVAEHVQRWRARMGVPGQPPLEINPYVRVLNNPLRWIDRTGFETTAMWGGDPFYELPDSPPYTLPAPVDPNGNYRPGFDAQIPGCDKFPDINSCVSQCCEEHDRCYERYGCNASSWKGNLLGESMACQQCNAAAKSCVIQNLNNIGKDCDNDCKQ